MQTPTGLITLGAPSVNGASGREELIAGRDLPLYLLLLIPSPGLKFEAHRTRYQGFECFHFDTMVPSLRLRHSWHSTAAIAGPVFALDRSSHVSQSS